MATSSWRVARSGAAGKILLRTLLLMAAAIAVAAVAASFGIAHDYGYLRATILTGSPDGEYYALGARLSTRARQGRGNLIVVSTGGSVENVHRLSQDSTRCVESFAIVQDGTPFPPSSGLEVLGRLPDSESLLLLAQHGRTFDDFANLRGAAIGIGPEQSGTAHIMRQLFTGPDLQSFDIRLSHHSLEQQAELVARGELDVAAVVMREDAAFLRAIVHKHGLDLIAPRELEGLIARHSWLSLGRIPAGRYDLAQPTPAVDRAVARVETLVVASPCSRRADRVALLILLSAELPMFLRVNRSNASGSSNSLPLAAEARQYFATGEPELADRYFPWLVNLLSPAYWVYLLMAVTITFKCMSGLSRFRLWRIDALRERLENALQVLANQTSSQENLPTSAPARLPAKTPPSAAAERLQAALEVLRARCQRQVSSIITPMGDEMFYRYQEFRIDDAIRTATMMQGSQQSPQER
jgi:TRAP-type uncharacterized transport system substrate-binding protein